MLGEGNAAVLASYEAGSLFFSAAYWVSLGSLPLGLLILVGKYWDNHPTSYCCFVKIKCGFEVPAPCLAHRGYSIHPDVFLFQID